MMTGLLSDLDLPFGHETVQFIDQNVFYNLNPSEGILDQKLNFFEDRFQNHNLPPSHAYLVFF